MGLFRDTSEVFYFELLALPNPDCRVWAFGGGELRADWSIGIMIAIGTTNHIQTGILTSAVD